MPNKSIVVILSLLLGLLGSFGTAGAYDPPHNAVENIDCSSCHTPHPVVPNSYFGSLTRDSNVNLCLSCHYYGGIALHWPFASSDQAVPGVSGTSHRWDRDMTPGEAPLNLVVSDPNNAYGLRTPSELATPALRTIMTKFSNAVVCSTCHQQHSQGMTPYDPYSYNASAGDGGGTATGGSQNTLADTSKTGWTVNEWAGYTLVMTGGAAANINQARTISGNTGSPDCTLTVSSNFPVAVQAGDTYYITKIGTSFDSGTATAGDSSHVVDGAKSWAGNRWAGYYVKMTGGANSGDRRRIQSNTADTLTLTDAFTYAVAANDAYYITSDRHFMRINNATADMCNDCHYYRSSASMNGGVHQTDVHTWDGNEKSHPVGKGLSDVSDPSQFNAAFLEGYCSGPDPCSTLTMTGCSAGSGCTWTWASEGGTRFETNGGADTNLTNNITVGNDGKVNCLSCHNVHFADSDAKTVDTPSGYAP
jgi:predicted CXXCH cytochrome family protein